MGQIEWVVLGGEVQFRSLDVLHGGHLDIPGSIGGPEWRRGGNLRPAEKDDVWALRFLLRRIGGK